MPTTPRFHLEQDDSHVRVIIRVPYVRVNDQTLDTYVDGKNFSFYCKPYLLRLQLSGEVLDDDLNPAKAIYDMNDQNGNPSEPATVPTRVD